MFNKIIKSSSSFLSQSFSQAKERFYEICEIKNIPIETFIHPYKGSMGEELSTDVAYLGPPNPKKIIVLVSGTHGIEGYVGSAIQIEWLKQYVIDRTIGILLIHAINPYGFSWLRRCDENNIDLNRNFIDFSLEIPVNLEYSEKFNIINPNAWEGETRQKADFSLQQWIAKSGPLAVQKVITEGQYTHAEGVFYGGEQKSWGRTTFEKIIKKYLKPSKETVIIDIHTGLGEYGEYQLINMKSSISDLSKTLSSIALADSNSSELKGSLVGSLENLLPNVIYDAYIMESGILPALETFMALRADNWLHNYGDLDTPLGLAIKNKICAAFRPEDPKWFSAIKDKALNTIDQVVKAFAY